MAKPTRARMLREEKQGRLKRRLRCIEISRPQLFVSLVRPDRCQLCDCLSVVRCGGENRSEDLYGQSRIASGSVYLGQSDPSLGENGHHLQGPRIVPLGGGQIAHLQSMGSSGHETFRRLRDFGRLRLRLFPLSWIG